MKRLGLLAVVGALAVTGCGGDAVTQSEWEREEAAREGREAQRETTAESDAQPQRKKPATADPTSGRTLIDRVASEARELCGAFPQAEIARQYGVPNELEAVATAIASEYREGLRVAAQSGCIEGLTE